MPGDLQTNTFFPGGGKTGAIIRALDWQSTPLGPMSEWPESLHASISILLSAPYPMYMAWGKDYIQFYNDLYIPVLGEAVHPAIGVSARETYTEHLEDIEKIFKTVIAGGSVNENYTMPDQHNEGKNKAYSFTYHAIRGKNAGNTAVVITASEKIQKRSRIQALRALADHVGKISSAEDLINELEELITERTLELRRQNNALRKSEERYHKMVDEVTDYAILLINKNGYIQNWNKGAERVKGYSEQEIIGKHFRIFYQPEDRKSNLPEKLIQQAIDQGSASHEGWRVRKDGSKFWGSIVITPLHDENNNIIGFTKVTRDLTEKKLAEDRIRLHNQQLEEKNAELQHQRDFAESILDNSIDIMIVYDTGLRFLIMNKEGELKYNVREEDIAGRYVFDVFPHTKDSKGHADLLKALEGETTHNKLYKSPITGLYYENFVIPLKTVNGDVYAILMLAHDITDNMKAAEKLRQTNTELVKSNRDLEQFAYVASHDLQEPLRKIQIFTDLLQNTLHDHETSVRYFNKINASAKRMTELIKAVLNYSRLSSFEELFETVDLNQVLEHVKTDFELLINEKKAIISAAKLPVINGISLQMYQLFYNLIGNSLKFSERDPFIRISCEKSEPEAVKQISGLNPELSYFHISFSDNGIGFEQEYVNKIFTIFQRLNDKQKYAGTGIGLALCKKIIENHHGLITASGEMNKGAVFHIYLPAQKHDA